MTPADSISPELAQLSPALTQYSPAEEKANTWSHGIGLMLSLLGAAFMVAAGQDSGNIWVLSSFVIYSLCLLSLYLASTLYHGAKTPKLKRLMKTFDHCAIYLLIAGTYTPFMLVTIREGAGGWMMASVWGIAVAGIILKIGFPHRFHLLRVLSYVVLGWLVVLSGSELFAALHEGGVWLLSIGGIVYTLGVIFYVGKSIPFNHAIWHDFVLAGSACHYFAIYLYVWPPVA